MRSKPTLTPLLGTALAAVAAGSLLAFSLVAQQAGLGDLKLPESVTARGPGGSLGAITLPGAPGNPAAGPSEPAPTAPEPTLLAESAPAPEAAPAPAPQVGAPSDEVPSFDGLDDDRRPASTARVGNGELERGWQREGHGRASAKRDSSRAKKHGSHKHSVPPGHARKSGARASDRDRGNGPPSTPPGHAKQEARGGERGHGHGHAKQKERGKHKGRAKHH